MEEKDGADAGTAMAPPLMEQTMNMNILVAIDDSDESFHALQWALDKILVHADAGGTATTRESKVVTIVHVLQPMPRYGFPSGYGPFNLSVLNLTYTNNPVEESTSKAQEQNAARILSRAFDLCREKSLTAKTLILEGDPKDTICRAVDDMNIHLLVIGSRGLGQIKRYINIVVNKFHSYIFYK
ncbi:universal stress protein A-like protein [Dorcoceras hygrometricum]|uniref:Universal stress protein A-like protein n=1 Tax=Dorcoceras hygrometricum TaxID=472368 RepID=A0A2Z7B3Q4_9LAMI|nr:universal stress protein A-like protein [Dorcoceras hygrometricum]